MIPIILEGGYINTGAASVAKLLASRALFYSAPPTRRGAFPEPNPLFRAQGHSGVFRFLGLKGQRKPLLGGPVLFFSILFSKVRLLFFFVGYFFLTFRLKSKIVT